MTAQVEATSKRAARRPALDRDTVRGLMTTEYQRVIEQLRSLSPEEWHADTCNPGWDVRALAAHMLGMTAMVASVPEQIRQMRAAKKRGGEFIDALTALQVEKYDGWSPERLVAEYERLAPKAVRGRGRMPGLLRSRTMPEEQPIDPPHQYETWTFAYLVDVILTRDPWLHRTDIAAATRRELDLTSDHDAVLVADVAREWAARHGQPCTLTLTGPAGRRFVFGPGGVTDDDGGPSEHGDRSPTPSSTPSLSLDAIEFCRILSGRGSGDGLLATRVPF